MKYLDKILVGVSCMALLSIISCTELDLEPEGATLTETQKKELVAGSPEKLQADINGLASNLIKYASIYNWSGSTRHFDFGYASACIMFDATSMDEPSEVSGYNWYNSPLRFVDRTQTHEITYYFWNMFYTQIKLANDILTVAPAESESATLKAFRGQALAARAFSYLHLVQLYQFTYKGHENSPAVPIVTENTTTEQAANNPRATVQQVYDLIMSDLNEAITLLSGYTRATKDMIDQNVAYGLRARANLLMQNWAAAAEDADKAMSGYTPYSREAVSKPTFNNISVSSWIWGNAVTETNDIVKSGILNFPSMMCSFTGNGYSPGYAGRYINSNLWARIPETDVRKGWWIDEEYNSPNVDMTWTATYNGKEYGIIDWFGWNAPYLNVKFGPYQDIYNNSTNACDFPMMRAEEMILIKAEGLGMTNVSAGKQVLEDFVKTYRDPSYECKATDAVSLQDEIWFQRRVELWGEGFSFFDVLRLKKDIDRRNSNYASSVAFYIPAESQIMLYIIPEDEITSNEGISESDNNPVVSAPTP